MNYNTNNTLDQFKIDNNNNNNYNEYNNKLYNSVFSNIYLKRIIFYHLSKFNIYFNIEFKSIDEWNQFKYKEYLNNVSFRFQYYEHLNELPPNIKQINITTPLDLKKSSIQIPDHIESIGILNSLLVSDMNSTFYKSITSTPSKLKSLFLYNLNQYKIKKDTLPSNLNTLALYNIKDLYESDYFSSSISKAELISSNPLIINQFPSNGLVKLDFSTTSKVIIDNSIKFPNTLQHLYISCFSFNTSLPDSLKSLRLNTSSYVHKIVYPQSLESLFILYGRNSTIHKNIFQNKSSLPNNLKSLEFSTSTIVNNNGQSILPDKLETLKFLKEKEFNQVLKTNQLPSTLTHLNLGGFFDQYIDINVLPSCLKTLQLGDKYSQIINPLSIPRQLELLIIDNPNYNHPINLLPTHPNTEIICCNLNLYYNVLIRKLCLPDSFNFPLSTLQLQDKSSLEYLNLGSTFNQTIQLSDLPINNNIKTLVLGYYFNQTFNLELFQNLETLILSTNVFIPKIITTETITNQQQGIVYNNYKLKYIKVPLVNRSNVLKSLDTNFHQFLKLNNNT